MSKQIDFLKRCIALNLQSGGLLDLLDRIEELERKVASRDAEIAELEAEIERKMSAAEFVLKERDQLRAQVKILRDAMLKATLEIRRCDYVPARSTLLTTLAATEPKP